MTGRVRPDTTARLTAAALLLVGLLTAAGIVVAARSSADLRAEVRTRELAAQAVPSINATLRTALTAAESSSGGSTRRVDLDRSESAGIPRDVAVRARDTGRAVLVDRGAVVAATYSAAVPPTSVAQRRATVTGLFVVPLEMQPTIDRLRPTSGGISLHTATRTLGTVGGPPPDGATTWSVPIATSLVSGWTVDAWAPTEGVGVVTWLLAGLCVVAGAAAAAYALRRATVARTTESELHRLREQSTVLASLASVAQRSLELADVLPAVCTQLSDALGLWGLSLTEPTAEGHRAFFRHGHPPAPATGQAVPDRVAAGESVSVLLARGTRTVARLNILAGRDLDAEDLATLAAAADILTSALTNAEAFAQQREVLQRLRAVDELKTVFLATASHELRTPVGVISGFAELLATYADDLDQDRVRDYASRIDATAQQLAALVENLLDFSRVERGVELAREQSVIDLGETVAQVLADHQDLGAHHDLGSSISSGVLVRGTEHAVERVLTNLVGNAAKYSPAGTAIRVTVREEGGRAVVHVDDEGAGVAPQDRAQVFSRFYRGTGDAVVNTRGAGLGLAIVHEFAASMGGVASVDEAPSGGARFTISYPLADRETDADDEEPDPGIPAARSSQTPDRGATDVLT